MRTLANILSGLALVLAFAVQAKEKPMVPADPAGAPPPDKALVVFMRPTSFGGAIKATLYDVTGGNDVFIGISTRKTQIAYLSDPGERLFMIVGENGDFMDAQLVAGKTYYVLVSPRMGVWKARFSLLPIHKDPGAKYSVASDDFAKWKSKSKWVKRGPGADQWYAEHKADIAKKKADYLAKWNARPAADKKDLLLLPDDGV